MVFDCDAPCDQFLTESMEKLVKPQELVLLSVLHAEMDSPCWHITTLRSSFLVQQSGCPLLSASGRV